jgi:hypothetical protein
MNCPIITAVSIDQIPALLLIVAVMLAPYGVATALTRCFPKLALPYRDNRVRMHDSDDLEAMFRRFEADLSSERR